MVYCDSPTLDTWRPLPPSPDDWLEPLDEDWTKLIAGDVILSNSIEYANWDSTPVWPNVCERCYAPECAWSGLAHIVRLPDQVLWVRPTVDELDEFWRDSLGVEHFLREPVVMPRCTWDALTAKFPQLTPLASLPPCQRKHLGRLWLDGVPRDRDLQIANLDELRDFVQSKCLASDPVDWQEATDIVLSMIDWLESNPSAPVTGRVVRRGDFPGRVNTLYFDGPPFHEWGAFALWTRTYVLDEEWVFVVDP